MRLHPNELNRGAERDLAKIPDAAKRLARLLHLIEQDLASLPLDGNLPAPVAAALKTHTKAIEVARLSIAAHATAGADVTKAAAADVKGLAAALKAGKAFPKALRRRAAKDAAELTAVTLEAAEALLKQTQTDLVDAMLDNWSELRQSMIAGGEATRAAIAELYGNVLEELEGTMLDYASVTALDSQLRARFPRVRDEVDAEVRDGVGWYRATHDARAILKEVRVPDPAHKGQTIRLPLLDVARALHEAIANPGAFAAGAWAPPSDPEHDAIMATPLPADEPWVEAAVARELGRGCAICGGGSKADMLTRIGGRLALVHSECTRKPPSAQEKKDAARVARMQRTGYPTPPHQSGTVYGTGDYAGAPKDKDFSG